MDRWVMDLEAVNRALAATVRKQEEELKVLRAALTADNQTLRLHLGEMTAQEMRTLRAGFRWALARAVLGGNND
jgi:hypothetical protein